MTDKLLMKNLREYKKFLIVGYSGRGKTTMAKFLAEKLKIPHTELDDFYWIRKFSIKREKEERLKMVIKFLEKHKEWIIEGTSRDMVSLCMNDAEIIVYMSFPNLFTQLFYITKRAIQKKEKFLPYLDLCYTTVLKKYKIGKKYKGRLSIKEILERYKKKVIPLNSWKDIEDFKKNF